MQHIYFGIQHVLQRIGQWFSHTLEDGKQKNSIAVLDGVRAIACVLVIAYHIDLLTSRETHVWFPDDKSHRIFSSVALAGASGVTLFFVLSGFLLFLPYAKALLFHSSWPSARLFYLRRVLRIVPAYYVSLFLIVLLFQPQYLQRAHWKELGLFLTFFMDSTQLTNHKLNGPFWTLAVEWQYYMLLPLLVLGFSLIVRRGSVQRRLWMTILCLVGLIGWGLFSRYWGLYFAFYPTKTFLVPRSVLNNILFFTYGASGKYLEDFAVGMLISLCYVYSKNAAPTHPLSMLLRRLSPWLWRLGIVILVFVALWHLDWAFYGIWAFLNVISGLHTWLNPFDLGSEICLAVGFGLCVLGILYGTDKFQRPFAWAPLRWLGLISYSMYMWHLPLIAILLNTVGHHLQGWNTYAALGLYWCWVLIIVLPVSFLMYIWVEKPWMKLGDRFRRDSDKPKTQIGLAPEAKAEPVLVNK